MSYSSSDRVIIIPAATQSVMPVEIKVPEKMQLARGLNLCIKGISTTSVKVFIINIIPSMLRNIPNENIGR